MPYYHASPVSGIKTLEPRVSNHGTPLIYFSEKRENVLVYLSNAGEKCCRENGFSYDGIWQKWASYGFDKDGILRLEEYWPDALRETYAGVSGYIYRVDTLPDAAPTPGVPRSFTVSSPVAVDSVEFIPDAYEAILAAVEAGLIRILRYEETGEKMRAWIEKAVRSEYAEAAAHPEYRFFLEKKFGL